MHIRRLVAQVEKVVIDNSPLILTAIGATGTVATAFLTGKASFEAAARIEKAQDERALGRTEDPFELSKTERMKVIWTLYIPAAGVGSITILAIVFANRISTKRAAALAAAFALSENRFTEYRDKVSEIVGKNKEQKVRDEVAQDHVNAVSGQQVIVTGSGESLFQDEWSGRQFMSTMEAVKSAQNEVNYRMMRDGYASMTDFYNELGLPGTKMSEELGWNSDNLLEVTFSTALTDDQKPCITIDFRVAPTRGYFRARY